MAARKPAFRRTLREDRLASNAAQSWYASMLPVDDPRRAEQEHRLATERAQIAPKRVRAAARKLEAPVVAAISELLAVHPRVIWAARFNSGSAMAASGAPIWFHRMLRMPEPMRMPDFFGLCNPGNYPILHCRPLAIEAKPPGWTKPTNDREREQAAFLAMVRSAGGIGIFATSAEDVAAALE